MTKVLIAEDERPIARLLEMNLTRAGYVCTLAPDGLTAADLIEKNDYDLALLDIMLPGLDGYALLDYLRPQGVPVIFLTAKAAVKDRVLGLRLGADDYIVKPFAMDELMARMEMVLREFALLEQLMRNRGAAIYRDTLMERAWGGDAETTRAVDTYITRLRKKLNWGDKIETVYQIGYRLKQE